MGLTGEGTSADDLWELRSREAIIEHVRDLADERLAAKAAEVGEEDWTTVERLVLLRTIDSLWVEHLTELDDMRRGIGLRGYAQQDPLNEFKREAFQLYEELRGLIRHGVASSIFRVTVTRQPARPGTGGRSGGGRLARPGSGRPRPAATARTGRPGAAARRPAATSSRPAADRDRGAAARPSCAAARPRRPRDRCANRSATSRSSSGGGGASAGGPKPGFTPSGARIGRNDPCWCGSGAKYKKCHGR